MNLIWLGQSGFLFDSAGKRLLIDPFYSDIVEQKQGLKRLSYPPIPIEDLHPDVIFITHDHLDHFDPIALPEIHQQYPNVLIAGPASVMQKAQLLHFNPQVLISMPKGKQQHLHTFNITSTAAYHSDPDAVGCILKTEGRTIYYSGDTLYTATLVEEIRSAAATSIDVIMIVINGKLGNMNTMEALEVTRMLQPKLAIPMHYGMFAENTADPVKYAQGCAKMGIQCRLPQLGQSFEF